MHLNASITCPFAAVTGQKEEDSSIHMSPYKYVGIISGTSALLFHDEHIELSLSAGGQRNTSKLI